MTCAELVWSHSATGERWGEGSPPQAFTHISLCINNLRNKGEEVKAKIENRLTVRARTRANEVIFGCLIPVAQ